MRAVIVLLMLTGFAWSASAEVPATKSPEEVVVRLTAAIDIDTDGKVAALKWVNEKPSLKMFTNAVTPEVTQWKFEPGTLNGVPAATRTYLTLALLAKANEAGGISLSVKAASTGMNLSNPVVPSYPAAGVVSGVSAVVRAIVDFDVNGKGTIRSTEYTASRSRYEKHFLKAVTAAVDAWRVEPETVGGRPVAGTVSIPFVFCVQGDWCAKRRAAAKGEGNPTPVALDSAAKLRSEVEGLSIGSIAS